MNFLISNKITIASSCNGVGSCQKCIVNKSILSCQLTLSNFVKMTPSLKIEISYL
jgi:Na+-transporting NADH:ubiquinone oxidoreductase subunit NqrF